MTSMRARSAVILPTSSRRPYRVQPPSESTIERRRARTVVIGTQRIRSRQDPPRRPHFRRNRLRTALRLLAFHPRRPEEEARSSDRLESTLSRLLGSSSGTSRVPQAARHAETAADAGRRDQSGWRAGIACCATAGRTPLSTGHSRSHFPAIGKRTMAAMTSHTHFRASRPADAFQQPWRFGDTYGRRNGTRRETSRSAARNGAAAARAARGRRRAELHRDTQRSGTGGPDASYGDRAHEERGREHSSSPRAAGSGGGSPVGGDHLRGRQ